jgi:predicted NAD/FAD-binding protein
LTAAHHLHPAHDITVFEAGNHVGGHVHTHDVMSGGRSHRVDTGFIVFNHRTYPRFVELLADLDVASQPSDMSFARELRPHRPGIQRQLPQHPVRPARQPGPARVLAG